MKERTKCYVSHTDYKHFPALPDYCNEILLFNKVKINQQFRKNNILELPNSSNEHPQLINLKIYCFFKNFSALSIALLYNK